MGNSPSFTTRRLLWIGLALLLAAAAVAYIAIPNGGQETTSASSDSVTTLRLGYRPQALADVTPVVIEEGNLSAPSNLDIQLVPLSGPPDAFRKLRSGEIDAAAGIPLQAVFNQLIGGEGERPFQAYYLQNDDYGEGWVSIVGNEDSGVSSIEDLAGKPVASLPTEQAVYLVRRILEEAGVPSGEIQVTRYNPNTPLLGFKSGQHAALFGLEPAISTATANGHNILSRGPVSHFLYDDRPLPVSASFIATGFVEAHPEAYKSFVDLVDRAVEVTRTQPDSVSQYFQKPKYGDIDEEVASNLFMPVMAKPDSTIEEVTSEFVQDLLNEDLLEGRPDLEPLFPDRSASGVAEPVTTTASRRN
jgi:ABC-type nitrate/sulfonate/bicarbonate transport system substrate-binding protein